MSRNQKFAVFYDGQSCILCDKPSEYAIWGTSPMKTYCYEHLVESRSSGTCYVLVKNGKSTFMIDGKFKDKQYEGFSRGFKELD